MRSPARLRIRIIMTTTGSFCFIDFYRKVYPIWVLLATWLLDTKNRISSMPLIKPATWAIKATPPNEDVWPVTDSSPEINWIINQYTSIKAAGTAIIVGIKKIGTITSTLDFG